MIEEIESTVLGITSFISKKSEIDIGKKKKMYWTWNQESLSLFRLA